jgi:hypothetical protein
MLSEYVPAARLSVVPGLALANPIAERRLGHGLAVQVAVESAFPGVTKIVAADAVEAVAPSSSAEHTAERTKPP